MDFLKCEYYLLGWLKFLFFDGVVCMYFRCKVNGIDRIMLIVFSLIVFRELFFCFLLRSIEYLVYEGVK